MNRTHFRLAKPVLRSNVKDDWRESECKQMDSHGSTQSVSLLMYQYALFKFAFVVVLSPFQRMF